MLKGLADWIAALWEELFGDPEAAQCRREGHEWALKRAQTGAKYRMCSRCGLTEWPE